MIGRPRQCSDEVLLYVVTRRLDGALLREIAQELNDNEIPTPGGRTVWLPIHVSRLLRTDGGRAFTARVHVSREGSSDRLCEPRT